MFSSEGTGDRGGDSLATQPSFLFKYVGTKKKKKRSLLWSNGAASMWPCNRTHLKGVERTKCAMYTSVGKYCIWQSGIKQILQLPEPKAHCVHLWSLTNIFAKPCLLSSSVPLPSLLLAAFPCALPPPVDQWNRQVSGLWVYFTSSCFIMKALSSCVLSFGLVYLYLTASLDLTSACLYSLVFFALNKHHYTAQARRQCLRLGTTLPVCFWHQTWQAGICIAALARSCMYMCIFEMDVL